MEIDGETTGKTSGNMMKYVVLDQEIWNVMRSSCPYANHGAGMVYLPTKLGDVLPMLGFIFQHHGSHMGSDR